MRSDTAPAALLFDMDGLTVDTEPLWFRAESSIASARGFHWSHEDHLGCVGGPVETMARRLAECCGMGEDWREVADQVITGVVSLITKEGVVTRPGILELLQTALEHHVPVALVSGSPRIIVDAVTDHLPVRYDIVISSDDVTSSKPAPEPYLAAAAHLGVRIADCVAFEDSPTGTRSAIAAGAQVIVVPSVPMDIPQGVLVLPSLEGVTVERLGELVGVRR